MVEDQAGDRSLAAIMHCTAGSRCLKGVVAYVDVHSSDGDDASPIFAEMLKSLGARVSEKQNTRMLIAGFESFDGERHAYRVQIGETADIGLVSQARRRRAATHSRHQLGDAE